MVEAWMPSRDFLTLKPVSAEHLAVRCPSVLRNFEKLLIFASMKPTSGQEINLTVGGRERYRRDYVNSHLRELQLGLLDILCEIDRICRSHDIPYWLDSGTLLGAVRHGGFIPWDDDIDICMPREHISRFTAIASRELPAHLFAQTAQTEGEAGVMLCKVRNLDSFYVEPADDFSRHYCKGLYVDIFPMEPWPSLPYRFSKTLAKGYGHANAILNAKHYYTLRSAAELPYFACKRALFGIIWRMSKLICGTGKYYSNVINNSGNGFRHMRQTIFPLSTITFEGKEFSAPSDSDRYLRDLFGNDYMQLPPASQRQSHALFFATSLSDLK